MLAHTELDAIPVDSQHHTKYTVANTEQSVAAKLCTIRFFSKGNNLPAPKYVP